MSESESRIGSFGAPWAVEHETANDEEGNEHSVWAVHGSHFSTYIAASDPADDENIAHLIAAAPDLLAALRRVFYTVKGVTPENADAEYDAWQEARRALQKAGAFDA